MDPLTPDRGSRLSEPLPMLFRVPGVAVWRGAFGAAQAERLLWRAGFGPRPGEAQKLARLGLEGAVHKLTHPGREHFVGHKPHDEQGRPLADAWVETTGLPDNPKMRDGLAGALEAEIGRALARLGRKDLGNDEVLHELVERTCARICNDAVGKKPVTTVMISRLEA